MKPLAETPEVKSKRICEKLLERSLDDDDWTKMKLPTSLGGMGIRAVTSQLETSFEITVKKTRTQADSIEKRLMEQIRVSQDSRFERAAMAGRHNQEATALTNMEGSARTGGHAATQGEREKTKKCGNKNEVGPGTVKPISIELGGRPGPKTISVLQKVDDETG